MKSLSLLAFLGLALVDVGRSSAEFKEARALLDLFCAKCHGEKAQKGGVNFAALTDAGSVRKQRKLWSAAAQQLESKEMPPEAQKQPSDAERAGAVKWIKEAIAEAERLDRTEPNPGKAVVRRLNRSEYNRTIRDLLGIDFDVAGAVGMPSDPVGEAFDNLAEALTLSPGLMEKYFTAADLVLDKLYEDVKKKRPKAKEPLPPSPAQIVFPPVEEKLSSEARARQVVERLARRAYRRPLKAKELDRLVKLHASSSGKASSFEDGLRPTLKAILVSPNFLLRAEPNRGSDKPYRVSDHEMAVRLSYFLWSSMPDDELFALAERGELAKPERLAEQVRRMLKHGNARSLTDQFAKQWLRLDKLDNARPSTEFFPTFNGKLRSAMGEEVTTFFDHLRTENRSLLELLDADYTFVNADLARHYGIKDFNGMGFQKVKLSDPNRGGLLSMAAVLTLNSHTSRTSPTLRGKWILDVIFGTPPPPPPPDAGMIDESKQQGKNAKNFRELLSLHASQPACANCHAKIDPLGFGLERFDAIGRWRTGKEIDATGKLPGGEKFDGPAELKRLVVKRKREFLQNLARKMLSYALGRELQTYDELVVESIVAELEKSNASFETLVLGIAKSYPFQYRKNSVLE